MRRSARVRPRDATTDEQLPSVDAAPRAGGGRAEPSCRSASLAAGRPMQAAVVAATSFVAGVATIAVVRSHPAPADARAPQARAHVGRVLASGAPVRQLVEQPLVPACDVHLLGDRSDPARSVRGPMPSQVEIRAEVRPARRSACPAAAWTASCAAAAACSSACCTSAASPSSCARRSRRPDRVVLGALARRPGERRGGRDRAACASRLGVDDDLRPFLRELPRRPADRRSVRARAVAAPAAAAGAVRGAGLGDLRAADRVRARGRDRARGSSAASGAAAPRHRPARRARRRRRSRAARRRELQSFDLAPGRALALRACARRGGRRAAWTCDGPDHERGWAPAARDPGHRAWTVEMLALHGQGRYDQLPGRRPRASSSSSGGCSRGGDPRARATEERSEPPSRPTAAGPVSLPRTRCASGVYAPRHDRSRLRPPEGGVHGHEQGQPRQRQRDGSGCVDRLLRAAAGCGAARDPGLRLPRAVDGSRRHAAAHLRARLAPRPPTTTSASRWTPTGS